MRVETHRAFRDIRSVDATRVAIYDKFDNPLAVAIELGDGVIEVQTIDSPKFPELLRQLGILQRTSVQDIQQIPLPEIRL